MQDDTYILSFEPIDRRHRARDTVLTLLMWGIYIYLWIPLITLGAWLVGFERFYEVMITFGGMGMVLDLLDWYAFIIISISTCVVTWSGINYRRFHNKERRTAAPASTAREIGEFFGVAETEVIRVRASRRLMIDLDELGCISKITHYGFSDAADPAIGTEVDEVSSIAK